MNTLLVWREKLQRAYASYSIYILKGLQFVMGLVLFGLINANIGFMETASSVFCTAGLAVVCTFLPMIVMTLAAAALVLVHFYALSMPIAIVSLIIFLVMYIFYFRFTPGKAWLVLGAALLFGLKVPLVVPVVFGLVGTPVWIVPAACGIISYYMVDFVKNSATALGGADADGLVEGLMSFARQVLANKEMWLMILAVTIGILVAHVVRTRPVDHAWKIASASGAAVSLITAVAGNVILSGHISYVPVAVSAVLGVGVGLVLEFLLFCVDYSRTENVQFEDDEYYYYVKAVPKIGVSVPEKQVKHITEAAEEAEEDKKALRPEDTDEILLTRSLSKELGLDGSGERNE